MKRETGSTLFLSVSAVESRYLRVTSLLNATSTLPVDDSTRVRRVDPREAKDLAETLRKRHVFSRHSWEKAFYVQRAEELADTTVIELILPGQPQEVASVAESAADILEKITILSASLSTTKKEFVRQVTAHQSGVRPFYLILGPKLHYLRSRSKRQARSSGLIMDKTFVRRFNRCGFPCLYSLCRDLHHKRNRVRDAVEWLYESRIDQNVEASVVKTAIALETLLIFDKSESLTRCLSERIAFLLSDQLSVRKQISQLIKRFYSTRSSIVHGASRVSGVLRTLEAADRLALLSCLVVAANNDTHFKQSTLHDWLDVERWTAPRKLTIPFSTGYLTRAMNIGA